MRPTGIQNLLNQPGDICLCQEIRPILWYFPFFGEPATDTCLSLPTSTETVKPSVLLPICCLIIFCPMSQLPLDISSTFKSFFTLGFINNVTIILCNISCVLCCNRKRDRGNTKQTITVNTTLYVHYTATGNQCKEYVFINRILLWSLMHTHILTYTQTHTPNLLASQKQ